MPVLFESEKPEYEYQLVEASALNETFPLPVIWRAIPYGVVIMDQVGLPFVTFRKSTRYHVWSGASIGIGKYISYSMSAEVFTHTFM